MKAFGEAEPLAEGPKYRNTGWFLCMLHNMRYMYRVYGIYIYIDMYICIYVIYIYIYIYKIFLH